MDKLSFLLAVQFEGKKTLGQSLMETVDNYFYFGGRKVVVEHKEDGRNLAVRFADQPVSTLQKVLKTLSYIIFPIPLAMLGTKFVLRKLNKIEMENIEPSNPSLKNLGSAVKKTSSVVVDVLPRREKVEYVECDYDEFKRRALLPKSLISEDSWSLNLSAEDQKLLCDAANNPNGQFNGLNRIPSGRTVVFILDSQPDFVFKSVRDAKSADDYISNIEFGRKVALENNLDLMLIPQSKVIKIGNLYFVAQEKAALVSKDFFGQKGVYSRCWSDHEMKEYMRKLFSQLIIFIVKTGFADVKYDNIPLTNDGHVALIDLDRENSIIGLVDGKRGHHDGILHYASFHHFDDFCDQARDLLGDRNSELERSLENIRLKLERRIKKDEDYEQFRIQHQITSTLQLLDENMPKFFDDENKQRFAEDLMKIINKNLVHGKNFSLKVGRKVRLRTNGDPSFERVLYDTVRLYSEQPNSFIFNNLEEVCQKLQQAGYIFRYNLNQRDWVKITC